MYKKKPTQSGHFLRKRGSSNWEDFHLFTVEIWVPGKPAPIYCEVVVCGAEVKCGQAAWAEGFPLSDLPTRKGFPAR